MERFDNKVVVITGGAGGIGLCMAEQFRAAGATVCTIDVVEGATFRGDVSDPAVLDRFAAQVIADHGKVDVLINNAPPPMIGLEACSYAEFIQALQAGPGAAFYLTKLFSPVFAPGASVINLSSSRARMSQPQTESYSAAKGAIDALTHSLSVSLAGRVRVNAISPGWIDTAYTVYEGPDALQQPAGRVGNPLDIAALAMFLASDRAGFITGENILVDGGMSRLMIYHGDHGWSLDA